MANKEVYIRIKDGEKESELKINDIDPAHHLAFLDGLFQFFDVTVDFKHLSEVYRRSGEAYKDFYDSLDTKANYAEEKPPAKKVDAEAFSKNLQAIVGTEPDAPSEDHFVTGIKYNSLKEPTYRCRYKCPSCKHESNHYIKPTIVHVKCYNCKRMLKVRPATTFGKPEEGKNPETYRDGNGNFFIAGSFERDTKTLADKEWED